MEVRKDKTGSLQQRVSKILRGEQAGYAQEASREDAVGVIFEMLQRAEADLQSAKVQAAVAEERIARLKWQLAKAQSESV